MKQRTINPDRLLSLLKNQSHFEEAKVETCARGWFVRARFRRTDGSLSPWIILHPFESSDGWVLRVFALCIEGVACNIDVQRLHATLNQWLRVGRFISMEE